MTASLFQGRQSSRKFNLTIVKGVFVDVSSLFDHWQLEGKAYIKDRQVELAMKQGQNLNS
jgi:hypothetical protein